MATSKDVLLSMFESIQKGTEYVLQAIPKDKLDYRVEKKTAAVGQLAFHIATMPLGSALFTQGVFEKFPETDVLMEAFGKYLGDSLANNDYLEMFKKSCKVFLEFFNEKTADDWINQTYSNFLTRGDRTFLEGFLSMQNHMIQHRGSLTTSLRSMGIPVSLQQYWGMRPL